MTCIAVIKNKKGKLVFASDRRMSWGMYQTQVTPNPKIVKRESFILAGTGSSYLCSVIKNFIQLPPVHENCDPFTYMHEVFFNQLIELLRQKKLVDKDDRISLPVDMSSEIVVGYKGKLFS